MAGVDWLEKQGIKRGAAALAPLTSPKLERERVSQSNFLGRKTTVKRDAQPRKWKQTAVYWISKHVNHAERVLCSIRGCSVCVSSHIFIIFGPNCRFALSVLFTASFRGQPLYCLNNLRPGFLAGQRQMSARLKHARLFVRTRQQAAIKII